MATLERFEDSDAWKMAREAVGDIYRISGSGEFSRDFSLKDQIRRSGVSIMSNIAEGFERGGNKEFINFLYIAKASCAEARSQLYIALDQKYINETEFTTLYRKLDSTARMIGGFISYRSAAEMTGAKFRKH